MNDHSETARDRGAITELQQPEVAEVTNPAPATPDAEPIGGGAGSAALSRLAQPRIAVPILLIVGILAYLVNLGGYPLYTKGEPREAVTIFDIVHGGGIILPMRAGVEIPSKPLLMHWIAALISIAAGGVSALTVRLPSALFAVAAMLVCYAYVRRLFDASTGFLAALMMGTTLQFIQAGTGARVDMTLTFFLEVAFFEFLAIAEGLTSRRMLLYCAIAMAVLTKGPVGLVLPGAVGLTWIIIERRWDLLRELKLVRGAILVAIVGGGWYIAASYVGGLDFVRKQILAENLVRFFGGPSFHEGHAHAFFYVELALIGGFMPWTLMLPIPAILAIRRPMRMSPRIAYLLTWFAIVLLFYSAAHSKRGVYLLALYPAFATALALYIVQAFAYPRSIRRYVITLGVLSGVALILTGVLALVCLAALVEAPNAMRDFFRFWGIMTPDFTSALVSEISEKWILAAAIPIGIEALGLTMMQRPSSLRRLIVVAVAATTLGALAANVIVIPAIANTLSLRTFTIEAVNTIGSHRAGYLGALNYDVAFYSGRNIPIVGANDPDLPDYLICWESLYRIMPPKLTSRYAVALKSHPTGFDGGGAILLLRRTTVERSPDSKAIEVRANRIPPARG